MTKNPFINAIVAAGYIVAVVFLMNHMTANLAVTKGNLLMPIAMLSLFVCSAAFMGFTFFFRPIEIYLGGAKKEAVRLFLTTLGTFAAITALAFASLIALYR